MAGKRGGATLFSALFRLEKPCGIVPQWQNRVALSHKVSVLFSSGGCCVVQLSWASNSTSLRMILGGLDWVISWANPDWVEVVCDGLGVELVL